MVNECLQNYSLNWFNMNKHFLSLYIHSKSLGLYKMFDIFDYMMEKVKVHFTGREKCLSEWMEYSRHIGPIPHNWKKPRYPMAPIEYILPSVAPRHILNFLYQYGYTIEEFCASVAPTVDNYQLLLDAIRVFTEIHNYLDHPFCKKTQTSDMSHYCPISSLTLDYYFDWNHFVKHDFQILQI